MPTKKLTEEISVAGQISAADVAGLPSQGFKSIICNRPDGEESGQPKFREIADAAAAAGMEVKFVPIAASRLTEEDVAAFGEAFAELPKPVLAYCRSGTRCTIAWAKSQAAHRSASEIVDIARAAGFDVKV